MEQLTNLFQVHKTVKFELRPIGRTAELINSDGFLASDDKDKAMAYQHLVQKSVSLIRYTRNTHTNFILLNARVAHLT